MQASNNRIRPLRSTMNHHHHHSNDHKEREVTTTTTTTASHGDIVTLDLELIPENDFVPESLFDTTGRISFVVGWGNYLPGLHELVLGMAPHETRQNVSIDAGFGRHHPELVLQVPKKNLKKMKRMDKIVVGATLNLERGIQVVVVKVTEDTIVVDANHPLAGSSYKCSLKVVSIDPMPTHKLEYPTLPRKNEKDNENKEMESSSSSSSPFEIATLAIGCFWSVELAMMRLPGVVGTRAGYTQGIVPDPSYQEVCQGNTKHREAVMVVYDSRVVSYEKILAVYMERVAATESQYTVDLFAEEDERDSLQYKQGIYFHNDEQRKLAEHLLSINNNRYDIELLKASTFYHAEEMHQQYLYKGGQSARKNARETIRCFG